MQDALTSRFQMSSSELHLEETRRRRCYNAVVAIVVVLTISIGLGSLLATACALYAGRDEDGGVHWDMLAGEDGQDVSEPGFGLMLVRSFFLISSLLPVCFWGPLALASPLFRSYMFYPLVAYTVAQGGPALQKWGQWSATRPDMFPQELCERLRVLHANVPSHPWRHTRRVVQKAFKQPLEHIFATFEQHPVASGSIAQIHAAVWRQTGEHVAVKVLHPKVMEHLWVDVQLMRGLAWLMDTYVPALHFLRLRSSVAHLSHTIAVQTRLDLEAQNLQEMRRNFRASRWKDIRVPRVIFATPTIIVESFEAGIPAGQAKDNLTRLQALYMVNRGQDMYLKMLLTDKFMHADLHPGNMLLDLTSCDSPLGMVLVDFGMVARLTEAEQINFVGLMRSMGDGNGRAAAQWMLRCCTPGTQRCAGPRAEAFTNDMADLFNSVCRGYGTGTNFGDVLRGALNLVRKHEVSISANYATLVVNALCLDGLAAHIAPEYNLIDGCAPLLRLSVLLNTRVGSMLLRAMYPVVSRFKQRADRRLRARAGHPPDARDVAFKL